MAEKIIRQTQEEEIIQILNEEGFEELTEDEVKKEPYRTIYSLPDCYENENRVGKNRE
ncbi:MAG: hypothetical protein JRC89_03375 [Deltaproteobacteria bacterium]|nr:hypothetical protein [Deltaproteobacteria bacterium]